MEDLTSLSLSFFSTKEICLHAKVAMSQDQHFLLSNYFNQVISLVYLSWFTSKQKYFHKNYFGSFVTNQEQNCPQKNAIFWTLYLSMDTEVTSEERAWSCLF